MTPEEMSLYDFMVDESIATAKELNLAYRLAIEKHGNWLGVLNEVLYIRTGYRSLNQYLDAQDLGEE